MELIIKEIFEIIDVGLILSNVLLSYLVFKIIDRWTPTKGNHKRIATFGISMVLGYIYYKFTEVTLEQIIPSYLLSIVAYDKIIRVVLQKLKIDYK